MLLEARQEGPQACRSHLFTTILGKAHSLRGETKRAGNKQIRHVTATECTRLAIACYRLRDEGSNTMHEADDSTDLLAYCHGGRNKIYLPLHRALVIIFDETNQPEFCRCSP
mmetsp:Transcript_9603/g.20789  ORF Transcript_9603/g.20789 Transcript_9603/m.20789 type:complete len:112 (-) Transcript_9603:1931-2266(-)